LRALIRQMSTENQLWGAPRIHGELLKLGFSVAQSTVAKYMVKRRGAPSQGRRTFLRNHAPDIAAIDLFVVPTIGFELLYGFVIVRIDRRDLAWINVTTNPTAEWIARQITEAFPWDAAPGHMIRDRDRIYGAVVTRRLRAMGHSGQAYCSGLTADRIDPARVFGPHHCFGRGTSAPDSNFLCRLLQLRQNASVVAQGCADFSSDPTDRNHSFTPDHRRASPSLRPGLSFRYTQASLLSQSEAELGQWRVSLSQALGPNGQIIVNLVLELELVIGKRPPVPPDSCDPIMRALAAWKSACRA
jgi:hypothetical protein